MTQTLAARAQELGHGSAHDYEIGSPHLTHPALRAWTLALVLDQIAGQFQRRSNVRVLEIGAGHGAYTDQMLAAGARVTVTEMSRASADFLSARYAHNPCARVVYDPTGDGLAELGERFDMVVCASVLHHIPDYLAALRGWVELVDPGGAFVSVADPLYYPRRSPVSLSVDRGAYLLWRLGRGERVAGTRSLIRRVRGRFDETNPRDMIEYHVLRQGCDEQALAEVLRQGFSTVDLLPYWSTPSRWLQQVGDRLGAASSFALVATGRIDPTEES